MLAFGAKRHFEPLAPGDQDLTSDQDVFDAARAFAKTGKLWKIHFRNVTAPIPYFVETNVDDGLYGHE
jgi:hypothetical protein